MSAAASTSIVNALIDGLPHKLRRGFLDRCERIDLTMGTALCCADEAFQYGYFPLSGFISLVINLGHRPPLELGLIGNEGMLGATLALGVNGAPSLAIVQGAGTALRMPAEQLRRELRDCPALRRIVRRYLYVQMAQLSRSAACMHFHEVAPRLARWLLMTHDRAHIDHFHLTHELLADMLGVRRSGVTIAAGALKNRKLISYARGQIKVLNRKGLEAASCECYGATLGDYSRVFA
jgi:CRP-like cAMP-binding protein